MVELPVLLAGAVTVGLIAEVVVETRSDELAGAAEVAGAEATKVVELAAETPEPASAKRARERIDFIARDS